MCNINNPIKGVNFYYNVLNINRKTIERKVI